MQSIQNSALGVSTDEAMKSIDREVMKPLPGSSRVAESVVEDEMAMFMQAQAQTQ